MNIYERLLKIDECAAEFYREPERNLFYRKSKSIQKYYEKLKLPVYGGEPLYPCGARLHGEVLKIESRGHVYIDKAVIEDKDPELLPYIEEATMFCFNSFLPPEHTVGGNMWTHSMPNYERVCSEGLDSYRQRIKKISDTDMRDGLLGLVDGIECYAERCVEYLKSVNADKKLIDALTRVPMYPCRNIYEAVVCWNFIMYIDNCDNLGCVASGLLPYYKGEDIRDLLDCLFKNLDDNGGWSMSLGADGGNALDIQCLDALGGKRRPMTELFIGENTPRNIWDTAVNTVKKGGGQPAFYNRDLLLGALCERFPEITMEDIKKFCGGGCAESTLAGISNVDALAAGINVALIMENSVKQHLTTACTFEDFYNCFISDVRKVTENIMDAINLTQKERSRTYPIPIRTLLVDDCIDKQLEFNNGGARYSWSVINYAGLINAIDSLAVIRNFIFDEKQYTAEEVINALKNNDEEFLRKAWNFKNSFGNGNSDTALLAKRTSSDIFKMLDGRKTYIGMGFLPSAIQFLTAASAGENVGATPDGRRAGSPLCESLGAVNGKDKKGITAMLGDVCNLALDKAAGTPIVNLTVNPEIKNEVFTAIIKSYLKLGGIQLQISCTDKKTLLEAFENPEMHRNLIVRVGGYSDYFHRVPRNLQKSIIERNIYS